MITAAPILGYFALVAITVIGMRVWSRRSPFGCRVWQVFTGVCQCGKHIDG